MGSTTTTTKNKVALFESQWLSAKKPAHPEFQSGDTLKVHVKIREGEKERVQVYEGVVIAFNNTGTRRTFTVRKISHGVGVERVFPLYSPSISKIEVMSEGKVRRAKLYYVRGLTGKAARLKTHTPTDAASQSPSTSANTAR